MSMRPGDNAKLAPEQEQALLNQLREQREAKANLVLQNAAQNLAMTMGELALSDLPPKAKEMAQELALKLRKPAHSITSWITAIKKGRPGRHAKQGLEAVKLFIISKYKEKCTGSLFR